MAREVGGGRKRRKGTDLSSHTFSLLTRACLPACLPHVCWFLTLLNPARPCQSLDLISAAGARAQSTSRKASRCFSSPSAKATRCPPPAPPQSKALRYTHLRGIRYQACSSVNSFSLGQVADASSTLDSSVFVDMDRAPALPTDPFPFLFALSIESTEPPDAFRSICDASSVPLSVKPTPPAPVGSARDVHGGLTNFWG